MSYFLEYSKSSRARCRRCEDLIEKGRLRVGFEVESSYGPGQMSIQWLHWGCLKPTQLGQMGVNANGFHSLAAEDQLRVVDAIKQRKIPDQDLSAALKPPLELPKDIAPSQAAPPAPIVQPNWPPSKPSKGLMVPRKPRPGSSLASSSQPLPSHTSAIPSSSHTIDLTSSPVRTGQSQVPSSSQSQVIDVSSSPIKSEEVNGHTNQGSTEASGSGSSVVQPGTIAEGREVKAERAEEQDESEGSPEPDDDVFYLRHQDEVVGIQHYRGLVGVGERVVLRREPSNRYDANAIQVININGQQVGHIPRGTAARLARLMDARYINVEGVMLTGNIGRSGYKLKIMIDIYGQASAKASLAPHLAWFGQISETGIPPATDDARAATGVNGSSSPRKGKNKAVPETEEQMAAKRVLDGLKELEKGGEENKANAVMDTLTQGFDVLKLPLHPNPPSKRGGQLRNDLMSHQSQGLLWMQQNEAPTLPTIDEHVQLWQRKTSPMPHWLNRATLTPQAITSPPELGRGGIMADAMGLGKTLTILSLVLATKDDKPAGYCNATLIVCPLSVLSNWETQLQEHIVPGQIASVTFYGEGRNIRQVVLESADIVLTTYDVLSSEFTAKKGKGKGNVGKLLETNWKRVVLDEGHTIRNPKAGKTKAAVALKAHRRWIVSGTPIVNGAKDLGSLLTFLKMCRPLDEADQFQRHIIRMLPSGQGALLLQAIMTGSCIRRTKEMQDDDGNRLVALPPVNFYSIKVDLHEEDRKAYDLAMAASKRKFEEFLANERTGKLPPNVLQLLTRLRQIACLSTLVPPDYIENLQREEQRHAPIVNLTDEAKRALILKLKASIDDATECPVCFDEMVQPRITMCGHSYCLDCISEVIKVQALCPMDRTPLPSLSHVLELPAVMPDSDGDESEEEKPKIATSLKSSAKIDELVKYLKAFPKGEKSLVFSQFTKFLEKIEPHLKAAGIKSVRLDGSMSQKRRAEVIDEFQNSPGVKTETGDDDREDSSATEASDDDDESEASEVGSNDDDYVAKDSKKRKTRTSKTKQPKGKRTKKAGSKKAKANGKGKGKARDGTQTRLADGPTVMLISLQAGSQGLNLTAAQNVFLIDPWWNSAITMQAIDRVNRIGQKAKEVRVFEIIAKDTIEDKILEIQAKKNELIQQAFAGNRTKETARQKKEARFHEIAALFGVDQNEGGCSSSKRGNLIQQTL